MDMECFKNLSAESTKDNIVNFVSNDLEAPVENASPIKANVQEPSNICPCVGMEFHSLKDVKEFYKSFAKKEGFGIHTRSTKQTLCILVCSKQGEHVVQNSDGEDCDASVGMTLKKCSTSRVNCKASLIVSKAWKRTKWVITSFSNDHNHAMLSPRSVSLLRCHKNLSVAARSLVEKFDEEGVPTGKVASMFNSGDLSFLDRNCWNHLRNLRRKNLDIGDAQAVFNHCKQKQAEDPNFFYAIQCDDESRMINFLWIDARSRSAYQNFGDVITFDTTYKTIKYNMPFAPFTGLNYHS
jgi:hypothetical protein